MKVYSLLDGNESHDDLSRAEAIDLIQEICGFRLVDINALTPEQIEKRTEFIECTLECWFTITDWKSKDWSKEGYSAEEAKAEIKERYREYREGQGF